MAKTKRGAYIKAASNESDRNDGETRIVPRVEVKTSNASKANSLKVPSFMPLPIKIGTLDKRKRKTDMTTMFALPCATKSFREREALTQKKIAKVSFSGSSSFGTYAMHT